MKDIARPQCLSSHADTTNITVRNASRDPRKHRDSVPICVRMLYINIQKRKKRDIYVYASTCICYEIRLYINICIWLQKQKLP